MKLKRPENLIFEFKNLENVILKFVKKLATFNLDIKEQRENQFYLYKMFIYLKDNNFFLFITLKVLILKLKKKRKFLILDFNTRK